MEESIREMRAIAQEDSHDENTNSTKRTPPFARRNAILTEELQQMAEAEQRVSGKQAAMEREYGRSPLTRTAC
jgi:hypothetical protein